MTDNDGQSDRRWERRERLPVDLFRQDGSENALVWLMGSNHVVLLTWTRWKANFRCAWRHLSEQNLCGRPRIFSSNGSLQCSHGFTRASITPPPYMTAPRSLARL